MITRSKLDLDNSRLVSKLKSQDQASNYSLNYNSCKPKLKDRDSNIAKTQLAC